MSQDWEEFKKTIKIRRNSNVFVFKPVVQKTRQGVETIEKRVPCSFVKVRRYKRRELTLFWNACLDLHGLTLAQAEEELLNFLEKNSGWVLLVTGKGEILRKWFIEWAENHPEYLVGFAQALDKHGGSGAFYLHIRKLR